MQRLAKTKPKHQNAQSEAAERTRILAVDDDERNLLAISEVLAGVGEVVCAQSGEEALRFLLKEDFAVILLDVLMPGLDGYETASLIRQREQSRLTPIIFLTAINKEEGHMLRGYDAGAVDFVFKPFDPVMLRSKVAVFVELHEKTLEIRRKAIVEQTLLEQALNAQKSLLEAERALRASEQRQEAILQSVPICFHARSPEPPFDARFVTSGFERLTGFSPERLTSQRGFGLSRVHPEDLPDVEAALLGAKEAGSYSCEFRWQCADGKYRSFLDQGVIFRNPVENTDEIVGTLLDITERRELEDRLLRAQRIDALGKLTGGLAHDFNNLLAAILSGLGLLERSAELDDAGKKVLDLTRRSATQGAELVNRMLAFSRRQRLKPEPVRLAGLAETMNGLVAPVLGGLVRFEWQIGNSVWPVLADASQLELALMNLVFNARDAMPSGGSITIRGQNRTAEHHSDELGPGDYVVISVIDTGSGIPADLVTKVIEPFFTTKPVGKGTGLGLSTVYGFAKQSGGTLRIESVVGRGTAMHLWLPRSLEQPAPLVEQEQVGQRRMNGHEAQSSVLLVDDSDALRELTAASLRQGGFHVTCAAGGAEALATIEKAPDDFDVIVTDFAMPLVSGLEVIRFARNLRANWPAVIITGYADTKAIGDLPADVPLLGKPFLEHELIESIRQAKQARGRA
ncbi:response regulator [Mesorhizobium sp. M2D.F.Ca.ET.223.01.1.1]|uniref:response regulator n=2 Tax=Mesorhizobium TaxID=68287 RepID=UPI000FCB35EF|nr:MULTISPECIES: response regulator [unclassified Mesorhizobium]TGP78968.1 response regulator [bacterium M00.F.Ca.ET.227.01.1.1]TGP89503.1 response regulator [bacterium M00.F.Ca.ET.221.01.1.1]TGP94871.1 response regulator [bacterium M00.F.Ca.ET.222.01.1.1]TGU02726.1 response regulator [bacterium M00.F.Ca.ET.163.01.1.1]TGU28500.1 response regulator [bacterium M00.F.Ca.ET.156.01.1.1]TGU45860.1 response regulator [bacterium M00.F.Ca.ET.146.01.1.1]TGV68434.1 response regulator [Mesorhizobium sp.